MNQIEKRVVELADKVGNSSAPQLMLDALPEEDQRAVVEVLAERTKFKRFMTVTWCALAVGWVWILSVAILGLPSWVRPVSSIVLALLILESAASWWFRRRTLNQLRMRHPSYSVGTTGKVCPHAQEKEDPNVAAEGKKGHIMTYASHGPLSVARKGERVLRGSLPPVQPVNQFLEVMREDWDSLTVAQRIADVRVSLLLIADPVSALDEHDHETLADYTLGELYHARLVLLRLLSVLIDAAR